MPSGSSASLTRRVSAITSSPSWSGSAAFLVRPTPCSPVIVPPSRIAALQDVVERAPGATLGVGVAGGVDDDRVGVAVAGVGDRGDLHVVHPSDLRDRREQVRQQRHGDADVLEQQRTPRLDGRERPGAAPRRTSRPPRGRRSRRPRRRRRPRTRPARRRSPPLRASPGASDCTTRSAPADRSRPRGAKSSTALMDARSISSIIEGRSVRRTATTASAAVDDGGERRDQGRRPAAAAAPAAGSPG